MKNILYLLLLSTVSFGQCYRGTVPPKEDIVWLYPQAKHDTTVIHTGHWFPTTEQDTIKFVGLTIIEGDTLKVIQRTRYTYWYSRTSKK